MIKIRELSNNIPVIMEKMDYLKTVSFGVWVKVGSAYESIQDNGMSHMLEHMFFKGTKQRSTKKLADDMGRMGGTMNACTCKEYTNFYVTTLTEHLIEAIHLLGDMLLNSRFDTQDFEREKGVVLDEILMYQDSPDDVVHEMLQKSVWKDHPLGFLISGKEEVVSKFTREDMLQFYKNHYVSNNILLSLAGQFDEEIVLEACEQIFSTMKKGKEQLPLTTPIYTPSLYWEQKDIEQVHMNLAFPGECVNSEQKYAASIANMILGGSESSRLFQHIPEEMGMSYSIYSYLSSFLKAGLSQIDVILSLENLKLVFEGIVELLENYREKGITEEELLQAKEQLKAELLISSESTRSRMNSNGGHLLYQGKIVSLLEIIEKINNTTSEQVLQNIRSTFPLSNMSLSLVGNIENQEGYQIRDEFLQLIKKSCRNGENYED